MNLSASCPNLRPLQTEAARAAAKLFPGAAFNAAAGFSGALAAELPCTLPPCNVPGDVALIKAEILETAEKQVTEFVHTMTGPFGPIANGHYLMFADLDNNATTGGSPSSLGADTAFQGAELVTQSPSANQRGHAGRYGFGMAFQRRFLEPASPMHGLSPQHLNRAGRASAVSGFALAAVQVPDDLLPPFGTKARVQAVAQQLGTGGSLGRLPQGADEGAVIAMIPPVLPVCSMTPPVHEPWRQCHREGGRPSAKSRSGRLSRRCANRQRLDGCERQPGAGRCHSSAILPWRPSPARPSSRALQSPRIALSSSMARRSPRRPSPRSLCHLMARGGTTPMSKSPYPPRPPPADRRSRTTHRLWIGSSNLPGDGDRRHGDESRLRLRV